MRAKQFLRAVSAFVLTAMLSQPVFSAAVDLATAPMVTGSSKPISPNIYLIFDDSTSMTWEYLPDSVSADATSNCFKESTHNAVYYNPAITYTPPVSSINADGTPNFYANSSFTAAQNDGFNPCVGCTTNLNTSFRAYVHGGTSAPWITAASDTAQQAYYYRWTGAGAAPTTCGTNASYTKVSVSSTSTEAQNFANWYSFYRIRLNMAKTAIGFSFKGLGDKYRVGFGVISQSGTPASNVDFLPIKKFDPTQKQSFYTDLYAAGCWSGCGTPTRPALAKAGRLYAGKLISASNPDPIQYSCQKNFAILMTDGYWNTGSPESLTCSGTNMYGPCQMTSGLVGDQDGATGIVRPYLDAGHYSNSLSDIAMYYYNTDLRPTTMSGGLTDENTNVDVSRNIVEPAGADTAIWQHMNTYTIGLGVPGTLIYAENYLQGGSTDYNAILQGTKNWPDPQTTSAASSVPARLDDLWHAAVNGRGLYLSARDPVALQSAFSKLLSNIAIRNGAGAAASTSNLEPVAGDNFAYVAQYTTQEWSGEVQARTIDLLTGAVSAGPGLWSFQTQLQTQVAAATDTRTIYTYAPANANKLKTFVTANLTTEKTAGYFKSNSSNPGGALSQYGTWTAALQSAATDDAMIAYLRGQFGNEEIAANASQLYRTRTHVLGDIVSSKPVYVKKPPFKYLDSGYTSFATTNATRAGRLYVGANDGMLHAVDATTGNEAWSYIPSMVLPNLYKLADDAYPQNHQFYVDGQITVGDAYNGSAWKTVLVGGLGRGGRGYYALDVTDPASPKALWEFGTAQDNDVGFSYGNPVITKRSSDGKWVVLLTSGYNNTSPGDGKARLYVLDAFTGAKLREIVTDDNLTDPNLNGVAKIANWVDDTIESNSTQHVYAGDLGGNLWKFDITSGGNAKLLGSTSTTPGNAPITMKPELGRVRDASAQAYRAIFFGTGRYLGFSDLNAISPNAAPSQVMTQTIFAVKDTDNDLGALKSSPALLVAQTMNTAGSPRTIAATNPVDWSEKNGWYLDVPIGERMTIDPTLQLGTFVIASNAPDTDYCSVGGTSWLYALDFQTGGAVATAATSNGEKVIGTYQGLSLVVGTTLVQLPDGRVVAIVTKSNTNVDNSSVPINPVTGLFPRRTGWRELTQ